ncbi:hypothetical protein QQY84_03725 [Streptococcus suis]|uniref:hypothetical protein n=1 Tax=Streptococcus suis TaxID=1307 RepID=UPI000D0BCE59|nr:hypothetical protein [Streptococcus suis]MBS7854619.1 hypothetical protein [Streptococcus suis]MBS7977678.1 hypothetical protein [Streptococcus suis]MDG3109137.1 hypothetical protein [Streptococcus suis]MDG3147961.1 hypothetical protein [Streptococcus suis]MDG3170281.1 hypothetical protein [Streptococcus suis]
MAVTLEELRVIVEGEIAPFQKKMKQLESQMKQTQNKIENKTKGLRERVGQQASGMVAALGKLAKITALAYLGKKMLDLGMHSTQMALEVSASVNQIKRQMGESSQAFLKWIDNNANAMNMSVGEATKYGAVYSNLFSNFIKDSNKLSAYTGKMLQTSAVIAQGSGRTMTDVMERIRSGLLGNTEAIEDLGINVNVAMIESTNAFKRFANGQSWQQLDYNTQQQIRLMAILEQATAKYGNTLQQSVNGRISLFKSLLSDAALNIGNAMLPIINAMMPVLNSFAMILKDVTAKLAEFISLMFNKKASVKNSAVGNLAQGAQNANEAVGGLGDAMDGVDDASGGTADNLDDTAKSAKKAAKELLGLAGFDEITTLNLNKDDSDGAGSGSGGGKGGKNGKGGSSGNGTDILPEIELTDMDSQFKSIFDGWDKTLQPLFDYLSKLKDLFKDGFNMSFRADSLDRFKNALIGIWQSLKDIFTDGTVLQAAARFGEKLSYALGQGMGAVANVVMGIAVFIAESLDKSLKETKLDIKNWLIRQFEIKGDTITSIGNLAQTIGQIFYDTVTSVAATNIGSAIISSLVYIRMGMDDMTGKIERDFWAFWERLAVDNQAGITTAFIGLLSAVEPIFVSIKDLFKNTFISLNATYDEHLKPFFDSFTEGFSFIFGTLIDSWNNDVQPVLDSIGQSFSDMFNNHIQPFVDNFLYAFGQVVDLLKIVWEVILQPFFDWVAANILPVLVPIFQTLAEWFVQAWNVIFDVLGAVLKILGGIIEYLIGVFTGDWEKVWNGTVQFFKGIWELASSIFMFVWNAILSFLKGVWNTIVAILQAGWDAIVRIFQGLGKWFEERWKDVENIFSNVGRWFGQKFSEAWNGITNAFSNVVGFFRSIYDSIVSWFSNIGGAVATAVSGAFRYAMNGVFATIENAVNGFIGMINGVIGLINNIPGVSLGSIGYVNLPRLARGGIVDSPTVAMIGEAGKEVVMPLENTGFLQTMGRVVGGAVVNALGGGLPQSSGLPSGDIVIMIGSREFGRFAIDEINKAQEQAGELLLNI